MTVSIRAVNSATDLPEILAIVNAVEPEPISIEALREQEANRPAEEIRRFITAVDQTHRVVGFAETGWFPWFRPGRFTVNVAVAPHARRSGTGTTLYQDVLTFALAHGATALTCKVPDDCAGCLEFARRFGFQKNYQLFDSVLDLATSDATRFDGFIESVSASGIRFFTFADLAGTMEERRKLYQLNDLEIDGVDDPGSVRPFEQFVKDVCQAYWFRPEWQILAAEGARWVGLSAVGETRPGMMYNMQTGVIPEYRRRKIALALKLLAIEACRKNQARYIRTNNHSENKPILAINQMLGYQPQPGHYYLLKDPASA